MNAGQDFIDDDLCDHYAFRQAERRLADLDHDRQQAAAAQGRDHQSRRRSASAVGFADRLESETCFKDSVFKFTPPKGATKIEIVPVKAK
jgi:hypothetical protein